jgi:hypothetical protein
METVNKTGKNIQVGDFIAIYTDEERTESCRNALYKAIKNDKRYTISFVEVLSFSDERKRVTVKIKSINCADGGTYTIDLDATKYPVIVK